MTAWTDGAIGHKYYIGDHYEPGDIPDLLTTMVDYGPASFPDSDGMGFQPRGLAEMSSIEFAFKMALVAPAAAGGWQLRLDTVRQLRIASVFHSPVPVCKLRADIPDSMRTGYELLLQLEDQGFSWMPLPARQRALLRPFNPHDEQPHRVWYSSSSPCVHYLRCLRDASAILQQHGPGLAGIPHGRPAHHYMALLEGKPLPARRKRDPRAMLQAMGEEALDDETGGRPPAMPCSQLAIQDAYPHLDPMLQQQEGETAAPDGVQSDPGEVRDEDAAAETISETSDGLDDNGNASGQPDTHTSPGQHVLAPLPGEHGELPAGPPGVPAPPTPTGDELLLLAPEVLPSGQPLPNLQVGSSSQASGHGRAAGSEEEAGSYEELLVGTKWGAFTLTPIQPGRAAQGRRKLVHGGYQAACPFHRLNERSGCKRQFRMTEPGQSAHVASLKAALYWCGTHWQHDRQRDHLAAPIPEVLPSYDIIKHWKVPESDRPARRDVRTDAELDASAGASGGSAAAGSSAGPGAVIAADAAGRDGQGAAAADSVRGRGRGRGRGRRPGGRSGRHHAGREGGRGAAEASASSSSGTSSATSSSSSSSSSGTD